MHFKNNSEDFDELDTLEEVEEAGKKNENGKIWLNRTHDTNDSVDVSEFPNSPFAGHNFSVWAL